jgi:hypothetical protein
MANELLLAALLAWIALRPHVPGVSLANHSNLASTVALDRRARPSLD